MNQADTQVAQTQPHISVCICTYKRPERLEKLLDKLAAQPTEQRFTYSIVVIDNDEGESARTVAENFATGHSSLQLRYQVEPKQNIALARNQAMNSATGEFIAFIDDDELPSDRWLATLFDAYTQLGVDGVLGPVDPLFEGEPPHWLVRGRFCERPHYPTGTVLHWSATRTGNVLFRRSITDGLEQLFNPRFGNGGEDDEFFKRLMDRGCVFAWCNEAVVYEAVPPRRWKRSYFLRRALLRGQNQRHFANSASVAKSIVAFCGYSAMLPFLLIGGQHVVMRYLIRLCDHAGKLLGVAGLRLLGDTYEL